LFFVATKFLQKYTLFTNKATIFAKIL